MGGKRVVWSGRLWYNRPTQVRLSAYARTARDSRYTVRFAVLMCCVVLPGLYADEIESLWIGAKSATDCGYAGTAAGTTAGDGSIVWSILAVSGITNLIHHSSHSDPSLSTHHRSITQHHSDPSLITFLTHHSSQSSWTHAGSNADTMSNNARLAA
eukprot:2843438-Rhodomonas_salina.4